MIRDIKTALVVDGSAWFGTPCSASTTFSFLRWLAAVAMSLLAASC